VPAQNNKGDATFQGVLLKKLVVDKLANQVQVEGKSTEVPLQALGVEHNKRRGEKWNSTPYGLPQGYPSLQD
jgi:hypothetical protein